MLNIYLTRIHEITILFYALSVWLYFYDFLQNNQKANKAAFWILSIVWFMQTIFLFLYIYEAGRFPILSLLEGLYFYVWILISVSLALNWFLRTDFLIFFTNLLGFGLMVIQMFSPIQLDKFENRMPFISELSIIHITVAIMSYAAFALSFIFSLLYLIQYDLLKRKKWGKRLVRLGDLAKLEQMANRLIVIGLPLFLLSLIVGLEFAYLVVEDIVWYDSKIIGSFACLFIYGIYLYMRVKKKYYGKTLACWNITSFLLVLINFFLFGNTSAFHVF